MAHKKSSGFLETVKTVVYAVLIALAVRTFAYEPFNIPSGSMIPTLLIGDYLFVSKASYGYSHFSLPFSLPLFSGRIWFTPPERGDVAVFKKPTDNKTDYIKRIIGLPGDRIQMKAGRLYINDVEVPRKPIEDYQPTLGAEPLHQYLETLPNGVVHPIIERGDDEPLDNTDVYTVPPGHYFAMGDNRDNSQDSRVLNEVGYIPAENLIGRAEFLFFSIDSDNSIRFGRIFDAVR